MTNYVSKINSYLFGGPQLDGVPYICYDLFDDLPYNSLFADGTLTSSTSVTISLEDYLPQDGYDYEICLGVMTNNNSKTSGKVVELSVFSGNVTNISDFTNGQVAGYRITRTEAYYYDSNVIWVPIKENDKYITLYNGGSITCYYTLFICGFKRIGTNTAGNDYLEKINVNNTNYVIGGTDIKGKWVLSNTALINGSTFNSATYLTINLDNYLPNDGQDYMVTFSGSGSTPSGSGECHYYVNSGSTLYLSPMIKFMQTEYHSSSTYQCAGNVTIPIYANDRNVLLGMGSATGPTYISAIAYRRIGKNDNDINYKTETFTRYTGDAQNVYYGDNSVRNNYGNVISKNVIEYGDTAAIETAREEKRGDYFVLGIDNGTKWYDPQELNSAASSYIAYGAGIYIIVGGNKLSKSTDNGKTWANSTISDSSTGFTNINYINNKFIMSSYIRYNNTGHYAESTDGGITFTLQYPAPFNKMLLANAAYGNLTMIAPCENYIMKSVDNGDTWTNIHDTTDTWTSVAYGNGIFIVVGESGYVTYTNDNGATWSTPVNLDMYLRDITFGNGVFVAVGGEYYRTTADGITWTTKTHISFTPYYSPSVNAWTGVTFANGHFTAINSANGIMRSKPISINWQRLISGRYIDNGNYNATTYTKSWLVSYR